MKKLISIILFSFSYLLCYSQDVITMKNGDEIKCKVTEVGSTEVKYKKADNNDAPNYTINKSDVFMITYKDGTKDIFTKEVKAPATSTAGPVSNSDSLYTLGWRDADKYYKGYKGAGTATFLVSMLTSGIIGLIPAIACSTTAPKPENLDIPNSQYQSNPSYLNGYRTEAKKIKSRRVWMNWGWGTIISSVLFLISDLSGG